MEITGGYHRRRSAIFSCLCVLASVLGLSQAAQAAPLSACDPVQTQPRFGGLPDLEEAVPEPAGSEGELTTAQAYSYMNTLDRASERVITGSLNRKTWEGRKLKWAIVGRPEHLRPRSVKKIRRAAQKLRDPRTPSRTARKIAWRQPAILWVVGAIHGEEESGTEASLRVLHELADRSDCVARQILDNAIVVILPVQNPDGREATGLLDTERVNAYGFDLNRDWVARTQPETDAKVSLLRKYPGPLFLDAHETLLHTDYFFPPNPDPIYHEIPSQPLNWIQAYGAAMAAEFDRQSIAHFSRDIYDLFYLGYSDTATTTGFLAAGMTFETGLFKPLPDRAFEHFTAIWTSLYHAAENKNKILRQWAAAYRQAYRQGRRGWLEPNELTDPGNANEVAAPVPDRPLRHYFIRKSKGKRAEARALVRRLRRMDVDVYRLRKSLRVPDYTPYGRRTRSTRLPKGTWYVPMAQGQKHWIQSMLHEDPFTPIPYFAGPQAWSQPLLFNLRGGYSGKKLKVKASRVRRMKQPASPPPPASPPKIASLAVTQFSRAGYASSAWARYLIEQVWKLPYRQVDAAEVAGGALAGYDVLLVPDAIAAVSVSELGASGKGQLLEWVNGGGHLISWRGGTDLAAQLGLTTAVLEDPTSDVPGSLIRVRVSKRSPLHKGVGDFAYAYNHYDKIMRAPADRVKVWYPPADSGNWFVSGFAAGAEEIGGTAAVVDEAIGSGRSTVFTVEPNLFANSPGFQKIFRNALLSNDNAVAGMTPASYADAKPARQAARELRGDSATIRLSVKPSSVVQAAAVLEQFGARFQLTIEPGRAAFLIENPLGLSAEQHPFARELPTALESSGVETIAYSAP